MSGPHIPEGVNIVLGQAPIVGAGATFVGDYISCKDAHKVWCLVTYNQADGNTITFGVNEATAVAPAGAAAIVAAMPIWANVACGASSRWVAQTPAATHASGAGVETKMILFEVDPAILSAGCDCIALRSDTVIAAAQYVSYHYLIEPRYGGPVASLPLYELD
jgi:hypothetical protein